MRYLRHTPALASALLATVALTAPVSAQAQTYSQGSYAYDDCKRADSDNKIAGGLIGAIAGGVIGSQVAGSGARTEGSVLGAALGAAAGAGIAGEKRDCKDEAYNSAGSTYYTGSYRTVPTRTYGTTYNNSGYRTVHHRGNSYYKGHRVDNRGYHRSYTRDHRSYDPLARVDRRIERLRREGRDLRYQARYDHSPWLRRAIRENGRALDRAKDRRRQIKRNYRRY